MAETQTRETIPGGQPATNGKSAAGPPPSTNGAPRDAAQPAAPARPFWRNPIFLIALIAVLCFGIVYGVRYWRFATTHVSTDDAAIVGDMVQIAPQVAGTVQQVLVKENQTVKAGDLLVTLNDATYRADVAQAQADLDMAIAQAKGAGAGVALTRETGSAQQEQAQGVVAQAESGIASAQAGVARSDEAVAAAVAADRSASANVSNAHAAVNVAIDDKNRYADTVKSAQAQVATAQAGVRAAEAGVAAYSAYAEQADRDAKRYAALVAQGAASAQQSDQSSAAARTASALVDTTRQQAAQARATVAQKQDDLNAARGQYARADAAIAQARAQLAAAMDQETAAQAGVGQQQAARGAAVQDVRAAQARREQALGQLSQARTTTRQVAMSESAQAQAAAKVEQARAALENAKIKLADTRIFSPVAGQVSKKSVSEGGLVQPGTPLMAIVKTNDIWVVANFKETQMLGVRSGSRAEVEVDALPGKTFRAHVESLSAATGATFALLPPDNATGNFTKVVQRVPVKIVFEPDQPDLDLLRGGMSVTATVETK
jgi:membrane fusion protein (multidrug efflux system)